MPAIKYPQPRRKSKTWADRLADNVGSDIKAAFNWSPGKKNKERLEESGFTKKRYRSQ